MHMLTLSAPRAKAVRVEPTSAAPCLGPSLAWMAAWMSTLCVHLHSLLAEPLSKPGPMAPSRKPAWQPHWAPSCSPQPTGGTHTPCLLFSNPSPCWLVHWPGALEPAGPGDPWQGMAAYAPGSWGGGWAEELYPSCPCSEGKARDRARATLRACPFPLL